MSDFIQLRDALQWMDEYKMFSCRAISFSPTNRTGGKEIHLQHAVKVGEHASEGIIRVKTASGQVREIRSRLITHFNGKRVTW